LRKVNAYFSKARMLSSLVLYLVLVRGTGLVGEAGPRSDCKRTAIGLESVLTMREVILRVMLDIV
jgi:hypothetical protein